MKKVAIFLAAIALTTGVFAQVTPNRTPIVWFQEEFQENANGMSQEQLVQEAERTTGIRRNTTPIAPATLLLLGLSGAVVGTRVVRNTKK
jgi:hypothetical protein